MPMAQYLSVVFLLWCSSAPAQPRLIPLGDLPGGLFTSSPFALSGNGQVAVGISQKLPGFSGPEAFRWTEETGMVGLGRPTNGVSEADGVSPNGLYVVGSADNASRNSGAVWAPGGKTFIIPDIPGGIDVSFVGDVSNTGIVVGGSAYADGQFSALFQAFRWTESEGLQPLGFLNGGTHSIAYAISADGSIIAGRGDTGNWLWTEETSMQFTVGNDEFLAREMTENGRYLVGQQQAIVDGQSRAFAALWSEESGAVLLDRPAGAFSSGAVDATPNAEIILGTLDLEPYIWFDQGATGMFLSDYLLDLGLDVEALGFDMGEARGISDDGTRFLVDSFNSNSDREALLIIIPAPASLALPGLTLLALGRRRRRQDHEI